MDNAAMHEVRFMLLTCSLLCALLLACSCELFDPPPAEVGLRITRSGKSASCLVQVFNAEGRQMQEISPNELGVVYAKRLVAGTYTFRFVDHDGKPYPAVRTVTLVSGATAFLPVELTQEKDPEAEAAASAAVRNYGVDDMSP